VTWHEGEREGAKTRRKPRRGEEEEGMNVFDFRERGASGVDERTEKLAEVVIGAAIEVHRHLGPGLPETSYRQALSHELTLRQVAHVCEVPFPIVYKGVPVGEGRLDMLIEDTLIVELKAVEALHPVHRAQVVTYLRVTKLKLALLINFNVLLLKDGVQRVINTH
jgi:GxxExxY protein